MRLVNSCSMGAQLGTLLVALSLVSWGCNRDDRYDPEVEVPSDAAPKPAVEKVLARAKLFLHLFYGVDALKMYSAPDRQPEVFFDDEHREWKVVFGDPFGPVTILLDEQLEKGGYLFLNGRVLRRGPDSSVDPNRPPLYTPEEMIVVFGLPHNHWIE